MRQTYELAAADGLPMIQYTDNIEPEGQPTAIAFHEWGSGGQDMEGVAQRLASAGLRLITFCEPSHSYVGPHEEIDIAQELAAHLDLDVHRVIGHGAGALAAVMYAAETPAVDGIASVMGYHETGDAPLASAVSQTGQSEFMGDAGFENYLTFLRAHPDETLRAYADQLEHFTPSQRSAYWVAADAVLLTCIQQPTLGNLTFGNQLRHYIHGRNVPSYLPILERYGVQTTALGDAGHFPHVTHEAEYAAAIARFMRQPADSR